MKNRSIPIPGLTKEMLAKRPVLYLLEECQTWIAIGFNLEQDQLTIKYLGVEVHRMPKVKISDQIFQSGFRDTSTHKIKRGTFFVIYRNQRYEITARYFLKTKKCELQFGKTVARVKGYSFGDPRAPNVLLHGTDETPWKVVLRCDYHKKEFVLLVQDTAFTDLPIQVDIVPDQP